MGIRARGPVAPWEYTVLRNVLRVLVCIDHARSRRVFQLPTGVINGVTALRLVPRGGLLDSFGRVRGSGVPSGGQHSRSRPPSWPVAINGAKHIHMS